MKWLFEAQDATGAYEARGDLIAYLETRATADSDIDAAALVFGELVGNVVRHAPGPIAIELHWHEGTAVLRVRDQGPGFEWSGCSHLPEPMAESGRGLFIVETIASSLAIRRLPECGTEAIVRLPVSLKTSAGST